MDDPRSLPGSRLRLLLGCGTPALFLEAHNAMSARIASDAGADALWASSLTLSCSFGYADDESLPIGNAIAMLAAVVAHSAVPVLVDGDTGSCSARDLGTFVRALERIGAAGVAFEDKLTPKTNSLLPGGEHQLATIGDFAERLRAAKRAQKRRTFVVVARTEALIAGKGVDEALARARAYVDAGADAVLVHSKARTFDEIAAFLRQWRRDVPVLCVPTTFSSTPADTYAASGVAGVIWANHLMRAAVEAMQQAAREIVRTRSAAVVEHRISTVPELWRLQGPRLTLEAAS